MGTSPNKSPWMFGSIIVSLCLISKIPSSTSNSLLQPFEPSVISSEDSAKSEIDYIYYETTAGSPTTFRPPTTSYPTRPTTPGPETSTCGQVLDNPGGYISYSLTQPYEPNERCIWIIQVPGAQSYFFSVTHFFLTDKFDGVVISTVSRTTYDFDSFTNFQVWGTNPGILLNGHVAIVTFYSNFDTVNPDSRGFRLYYEANFVPPVYPGITSSFVISATSQRLEYPPNGRKYTNNELTTFLFTPNFKYDSHTNYVYYYRETLDPECTCCDRINTYTLKTTDNYNGIMEWIFEERFCSNTSHDTVTSRDMILFLFQSDAWEVGRGFNLNFLQM